MVFWTGTELPITPSMVILEYLYAQGVVKKTSDSDPSFSAFVGHEPDSPDESVTLYDYGGEKDGRLMSTGENIFHPTFQVRVRSKPAGGGYARGYAKAQEVAAALAEVLRTEIDVFSRTFLVQNVSQISPPVFLGVEAEGTKRRTLFVTNYRLTIKESV